tara:strand:- start:253 stop:561 length:309 start_codon:yes stop_codon:yes gene_type:complete
MSKIVIFASFYPKKGKKDDVRKIIISMINPSRLEVGNEVYNFFDEKSNKNENISFHLFEIYKNKEALNFHKKTSHYKKYRSEIIDLLEKPIEVKILNSVDSI